MLFKNKGLRRFNIVDAVILLIALAIVFGLVYKFDRGRSNSLLKSSDNIRISFYVESMKDAELIQKGDTVKDKNTNAVFGRISDIVLGESVDYGVNSEGKCIVSAKPFFESATIIVEGAGNYSDTGVSYNNTIYYLNNTLTGFIVGQMSPVTARIIAVEKL